MFRPSREANGFEAAPTITAGRLASWSSQRQRSGLSRGFSCDRGRANPTAVAAGSPTVKSGAGPRQTQCRRHDESR